VATDVPARRAEPVVAEDAHELSPQAGDRDGVQGRADGAVGVPRSPACAVVLRASCQQE